jgi:hypothetical protein
MSHEINERDTQEGTEQAWHGLTLVKKVVQFAGSSLDWILERKPLFTEDGTKFHQDVIVASDDKLPVGNAVSGSYGIIQNHQLWETLVGGLDDCSVKYKVASIGSCANRTKVFISVELNEGKTFKVGNRQFDFYLNALSTHDGSGRAIFMDSSICTVCANTFGFNLNQFARKGKELRFSVKHSKHASMELTNVAEGIENLLSNRALFIAELDAMATKPVSQDQALFFSVGMLASEAAEESGKVATRTMNRAEELRNLFIKGKGNAGENRLDVFSAFTDLYTHASSGRGNQAQFVSSEFGSGKRMKDAAFTALASDSAFANAIKRGEELILVG